MLNFQRCSKESQISLLKVIKMSKRKLLKRLKKKPNQLPSRKFNRKSKFRNRNKLRRKRKL